MKPFVNPSDSPLQKGSHKQGRRLGEVGELPLRALSGSAWVNAFSFVNPFDSPLQRGAINRGSGWGEVGWFSPSRRALHNPHLSIIDPHHAEPCTTHTFPLSIPITPRLVLSPTWQRGVGGVNRPCLCHLPNQQTKLTHFPAGENTPKTRSL